MFVENRLDEKGQMLHIPNLAVVLVRDWQREDEFNNKLLLTVY